jgi:hypothetical protein
MFALPAGRVRPPVKPGFQIMRRIVETELLDVLPVRDPRAIGSRKDLRRMNHLMGHARIMARRLEEMLPAERAWDLTEVGAGDGTLAAALVGRLRSGRRPQSVTLVDRVSLVDRETRNAFSRVDCDLSAVRADVFDWLKSAPRATVIVANLFLHHFEDETLARLLERIADRCAAFIACEPRRSRLNLAASRMIGICGCNGVTRHDAVASVRAGFAAEEISRLWPADTGWDLEERGVGVFTHLFVARHTVKLQAGPPWRGHGSNRSSTSDHSPPTESRKGLPR